MGSPRCTAHAPAQPALCEVCARRTQFTRARARALAVTGGVLAITAAVIVLLQTRPPPPAPPPASPAGDPLEVFKRERLSASPCDHAAVIDLTEHLMGTARWSDALVVAQRAAVACDMHARLRTHLLVCHQRLNQWAEAGAILEEQLAEDPGDPDLWWRHGESLRYRDQNELAMIDFRQSLANSYYLRRGLGAVRGFMYAAEAVKAPCEAERAWRFYEQTLGGRLDDEARDLVIALDRAKTCVAERGTGRARIPGSNQRVRVTLAGPSGTPTTAELILDPRAGTTMISREIAERLQLVPTAAGTTATLWSEVRLQGQPARVARMAIGSAAAVNVDLVISDDFTTGDDGVIGLSFLWHFDVADTASGVEITAPRYSVR